MTMKTRPGPTRLALRAAKSQIARLRHVLADIAASVDLDVKDIRELATEVLAETWDHECEAEELRAEIEKLVEDRSDLVRYMVAEDADEPAVKAELLLELLDNVDARDSLAFVEKKAERRSVARTKRRR